MKPNVECVAGEYDGEEALDGYCPHCGNNVVIIVGEPNIEPWCCPYCGMIFKGKKVHAWSRDD